MNQARQAKRWTLTADGVAFGTLTLDTTDMPWLFCHFDATPAFEQARPLFVAELQALEAGEVAGVWEKAYEAIEELHLRLVGENGEIIDSLLLHIEGDEAWFRY